MKSCTNCQNQEYTGVLFCSECGMRLFSAHPPPTTSAYNPNVATAMFSVSDIATQKLSEHDIKTAFFSGEDLLESQSIRIRIQGELDMISLPDKDTIVMGRSDPNRDFEPDFDLTDYGAQRLGVSRQHLSIRRNPLGVTITDLGSANGSRLNGEKISPHTPQMVNDGDEIQLCKLIFNIYF